MPYPGNRIIRNPPILPRPRRRRSCGQPNPEVSLRAILPASLQYGHGAVAFGQDWRRGFSFHIPVRVPELWSSPLVISALRNTLGFLSDDEYDFHFTRRTRSQWRFSTT